MSQIIDIPQHRYNHPVVIHNNITRNNNITQMSNILTETKENTQGNTKNKRKKHLILRETWCIRGHRKREGPSDEAAEPRFQP